MMMTAVKVRTAVPAIFLSLLFALISVSSVFADANFDRLFSERKYKEALDYADAKVPVDKRSAKMWVKVGQAGEALDLTDKALVGYMIAWRMSDDYQALAGLARVYNKLQLHESAIHMARTALKVNSKGGEAALEYANAYFKMGKPEEAKKALESVAAADTGNTVANRELGNIYYNAGEYARALSPMRRSYRAKADGELAFRIGRAFIEISMPDSAVTYLKAATDRKNPPAEAPIYLARAQFGRKKFSEAAAAFDKADKKLMTANDYYMFGHSKDKTKDQSAAFEAHQTAVRMFAADKPREALLSRAYVARALLSKKTAAPAIPHLEFIAAADAKAAIVKDVYLLLAEAYTETKANAKAMTALEKAIAVNSKNVVAYVSLADHYDKAGHRERAKAVYEQMMAIGPDDPNVFLALGDYNLKAGRWKEALEHYEKSASLKKSAGAFEGAAVAALQLGDMKKTLEAVAEALKLNPNLVEARAAGARALIAGKDFKQAQPHLEWLCKQAPNNIEYHKLLAECYEKNKAADKLAQIDKVIVSLDAKDTVPRLRLARYSEAKKDRKTAVTMYKEVIALDPKHAGSLKRLAALLREDKQLPDAQAHMKKYLELAPNDAEAHRDMGDIQYELKNNDAALASYRAAIKLDPLLKGFYKRYTEIVMAKGQTDEVITAMNAVIKNGSADAGTYTTLGMIYQNKKQWSEAMEAYSNALKLEPANLESLTALAACQLGALDTASAAASYERVVAANAGAVEEHKILGDIYINQKKNPEALKAYTKYLDKASPDKVDKTVAASVGRMLFDEKKYTEAAKYLLLAGDSDPAVPLMYAEACLYAGNAAGAIPALEKLRDRKPQVARFARVLQLLATAYERDNKLDKAAKTYSDYIAQPGVKDAEASYKAAFLREKADPAAAMKLYEANIKTFPNDIRNSLRLGLMLSQKKETLDRALPLLQKCVAAADTVPQVWLELARVYNALSRDSAELDAYQKYAKANPKHAETNGRIGALLMKKGDIDNAMTHLELANAAAPNDPAVMSLLARGYLRAKRNKEAAEMLIKAKTLKPDAIDIRYQLYELYIHTGQGGKAVEEIKQLASMTKDSRYMLPYGEALIAQNKIKDAEAVADELLAKDAENADALMLRAKVLRARKSWDEALDAYKAISDAYPDHAAAYYERAETFMLAGKPTWAETFYKRALRADPQMGLAELGLAKLYKARKQPDLYKKHLEAAQKLSPENAEILEEIKRAAK